MQAIYLPLCVECSMHLSEDGGCRLTHMIMLVSERMLAFKYLCAHDLAIALPSGVELAPMCVVLVVFAVDFTLVLMHLPAMVIDMILHVAMQHQGS